MDFGNINNRNIPRMDPEEVIALCNKGVKTTKSSLKHYTLMEITDGSRAHFKFANAEVYVVVTKNTHTMFFGRKYHGVIAIIRTEKDNGEVEYDDHYAYVAGDIIILSTQEGKPLITPFDRHETAAIYTTYRDDIVFSQFDNSWRWHAVNRPYEFAAEWNKYIHDNVHIHIEKNKLVL